MGLAEETQYVFGYAIDATTVGLPVLAVLITSRVAPVVRRARTFALIALVEYGVTAILGLVSTIAWVLTMNSYSKITQEGTHPFALSVPEIGIDVLVRLAWVALVGVAGLVVLRVFREKQDPTASRYSRPYRRIDGLALLVIDAVLLLVAAVNLIPGRDMRLTAALSNGFDGIINAT